MSMLVGYGSCFDVLLVVCSFRRCCALICMTDVVFFFRRVLGYDFREVHWLNFRHQIGRCLRFRCAEDSVARDLLDGVVWSFDDDSLWLDVHLRDGEWSDDDRSELVPRVFVVFSFDAEVNLVSCFAFFVLLSKPLFKFVCVSPLCAFLQRFCVSDRFCQPLFPLMSEIDRAEERFGCGRSAEIGPRARERTSSKGAIEVEVYG